MYFQYLFSSSLFFLPIRFLNGNGTEAQTCRGICGGSSARTPHSASHKHTAPKLLPDAVLRQKRLQMSQISHQCEKGPSLHLQWSALHRGLARGDTTARELVPPAPAPRARPRAVLLGGRAALDSKCSRTAPPFLPVFHIVGRLGIKVMFQMVCVAGKHLNQAALVTEFKLEMASHRLSLGHTLLI